MCIHAQISEKYGASFQRIIFDHQSAAIITFTIGETQPKCSIKMKFSSLYNVPVARTYLSCNKSIR